MVPKPCDLDFGFHLNTYDSKQQILNHMNKRGATPTAADHLNYLVTDSYTARNGDRKEVNH